MLQTRPDCCPALAAALVLLAGAPAAMAQCNWTIPYVPDFDQKRIADTGIPGLPGNGGMYCVPTSVTNYFAYFANRGLPQPATLNGPRSWQLNSNYNQVTSTLATMGSLMNTSTANGTTGSGGKAGAWLYQLTFAQNKVVVGHYWCGGAGGCPGPAKFTTVRNLGGFVAACYGYYAESPTNFFTRDGGHCITINGVDTCSSPQRIKFRDPADDVTNSTQSLFVTQTPTVTLVPGMFRGKATQSYAFDARYKVNYGNALKFLDGWFVLFPMFALTTSQVFEGQIQLVHAFQFQDSNLPAVQNLQAPAIAGAITGMVIHPQLLDYYYITRSPAPLNTSRLYHIDPVSGMSTELLQSASEIKHLAFSRHGELYTCDGSVLKMFDVNGPSATLTHSLLLPAVPDAIDYDDDNDVLGVLMPTGIASRHSLVRYPRTLGTSLSSNFLPSVPSLVGDIFISFNPADGSVAMCASGIANIYRFNNLGNTALGPISLPPGTQPRGLTHGTDGHILYIGDGSVRELMPSAAGGWIPDPNSILAGRPSGPFFAMARSRTNHVPSLHEGPEWVNLPNVEVTPGVPDCYANCDGSEVPPVLNVNDFTCFLNMYAAGRFDANCDNSTIPPVLNINDFICFQQKFAAGCP